MSKTVSNARSLLGDGDMFSAGARTLAVLAVTLASMVVTTPAGAGRLSVAGAERGFRMEWNSFTIEAQYNALFEVTAGASCHVVLEGSFHSATLRKTAGALIGHVTNAVLSDPCRQVGNFLARVRLLTETLPWHVRYEGFSGVLPTIGSLRLGVVGIALELYELPALPFSPEHCLYAATETPVWFYLALNRSGVVSGVDPEGSRVPLSSGIANCKPEAGANLRGAGTISELNVPNVTLI